MKSVAAELQTLAFLNLSDSSNVPLVAERRYIMKLSAVQDAQRAFLTAKSELESLRAAAIGINPPRLDGLPRAKPTSSKVERLTVQIVDAERRLEELADELVAANVALIEEIFRRVKNVVAADVLVQRYILGRPFAEIAAQMNYSEANVYRLHKRGKQAYERRKTNDSDND